MLAQNQTSVPMLGTSNGWRGPLTCGRCGHQQRTRARGDHTRCRECGASIYVPANLQHRAILRPYRQPGPKPKPKADKAPRSVTTTRTVPNTDALGGLLTFATNYAAARAAAKSAPKLAPMVAAVERPAPPVRLPPSVPPISRVLPKGRPAYRLVTACLCPVGWHSPDTPAAVECPKHGRQAVLSTASADGWAGPLPLAVPA
jgi:hypothetical protein